MYEAEGTADLEGRDALAELKAHVLSQSRDAESWIDSSIAGKRREATNYYNGKPLGNEERGKSQIVLTEVRDTVQALLPQLMRVFFSGEKAVEFMPTGPEDVIAAEQATDYVNFIFQKDNPGFEIAHAAFKDALVRKVGIVKWWWDESLSVSNHSFSGLSEEAFMAVVSEPGVEIVSHETSPDPSNPLGALHNCSVKRVKRKQKVCIAAVPPEEFLIDRSARGIEDALYIEHRTDKTKSDLVAMGYPPETLEKLNSTERSLQFNQERLARNPDASRQSNPKTYVYREALTYFDHDGDGIDELLKVCLIGGEIVNVEPTGEKNYASFCPDPEPHTFFGLSMADYTMDIQRIKSVMMRVTLDSAVQSQNERVAAVEGQVNMADLLNNENGGIVRVRAPGMIQPLTTPFIAADMLPLLSYVDEIKENRTGQSKAAMGLDADALQSSTRTAVAATVSAAAAKAELISRIFAETGMKRLFRGILRLICRHQDQARVVRLRNVWVPMDPRSWNADMDMTVNVAIGAGTVQDRIAFLGGIAAKQEQILSTVGMDNPLVNAFNLYNTYAKTLELAGFKDPSPYFTDPRTWQPPPPKPDPAEILAQVEIEKNRGDQAVAVESVRLEREKFVEEADFKRDKLDADIMLAIKKMELDHNTSIETATLGAKVSQDRIPIGSITKAITKSTEGAMSKVAESLRGELARISTPNVVVQPTPRRRRIPIKDKKGDIVEVREEDM